jgi:plastocyanin
LVALVAIATAVGVVGFASPTGGAVRAQESAAVSIVDFAFEPATLEVAAGTTVTWTNNGSAPHTVTADDGSFDSGELAPGASFSFTFESAGSVAYHCNIHPQMTATITVAEVAAAAAEAQPAPTDETPAAGGGRNQDASAPVAVGSTGVGSAVASHAPGTILLLAGLAALAALAFAVSASSRGRRTEPNSVDRR